MNDTLLTLVAALQVVVLNYSPRVRNKLEATMYLGAWPGPREPKDFQPALDIITDQLALLEYVGIECYDANK